MSVTPSANSCDPGAAGVKPSAWPGTQRLDATADLVLVCPHLGDGGVQRVVTILANAWNQEGRRVCVVTLFENTVAYELDPGVVHISTVSTWQVKVIEALRRFAGHVRTPIRHVMRMLFSSGRASNESAIWRLLKRLTYPFIPAVYFPLHIRVHALRSIIRRTKAPVVVGFCGSTNIMTVMAARPLQCRVIISERNDPARQALKYPWDSLRPLYYNLADIVTANTRGALEAMRTYVDSRKMVFVPNPLLPGNMPADHARSRILESPTILIVGRLHYQKAHDVLFDAFALLGESCSEWRLSIVGRGSEEANLCRQAKSLGISERIVWHGQVPDPLPYYHDAEIFVLPSRHEGTPNALLEAMNCGMAVIISDASPGPLELIDDGKSGIVVPKEDPARLAKAITRLAADPVLRQTLGQAARQKVSAYSLPRAIQVWERLIGWQPEADESAHAGDAEPR